MIHGMTVIIQSKRRLECYETKAWIIKARFSFLSYIHYMHSEHP